MRDGKWPQFTAGFLARSRGYPLRRMSSTEQRDGAAAGHGNDGAGSGRDETEKERLDRNMTELLGELRVALPGVQVLFAFLLTVPFNQRFGQVSEFEKTVYLITLLSTAVATALLLAPSALHRIQFRQDDKKHIVESANRYAIAGFAALMVAVTGAVLLVTHYLYNDATAYAATIGVGGLLLVLWYLIPIGRRISHNRSRG
jgi:hypothetical protein